MEHACNDVAGSSKERANSKQKEGMTPAMRAHFCACCVGGIHSSGKLKQQHDLLGTIRKFGDLLWNKDSYIFMFWTVCSGTLYVKMASPHVYGLPFSLHTKASCCSYVASFSFIICFNWWLAPGWQ
jgi:hypothetical protein